MEAYDAYRFIVKAIQGEGKDKFSKRIRKKYKKTKKGFRVPEYEDFLIKDPEVCSMYASRVVGGRLPEKMHNAMICESLVHPSIYYITSYFRICK
jgi:hypothetical protein